MQRLLQDCLEYFLCGCAIIYSDLDPNIDQHEPHKFNLNQDSVDEQPQLNNNGAKKEDDY